MPPDQMDLNPSPAAVADVAPSLPFTELVARVCHVQGKDDTGKGTDSLQVDEMSETISALFDVLAFEYPISAVVFELERRRATRQPR